MDQSAELKDFMLGFYAAIARGDLTPVEEGLSRQEGTLWIGTDPGEWWNTREEVLNAWKSQLAELGGAMDIRPGRLQAWQLGNTGWMADQPIVTLSDGSTLAFRITAVFEREAGCWRMVQVHSSIGVPNRELSGLSCP